MAVVKLANVRLAFPALFTPKTVNGEGEPAFSAAFILDPKANAADIKALSQVIEKVAQEKWKDKAPAILKQMKAQDKLALHDGDSKAEYDGFPGNLYVSARSKARPLVIDRDKSALTEADGKPYAGCYVNASLDIWAQDNNYGKRVNASLRGVQFCKDGEAFAGGGVASEDEFDAVADEFDSAATDLV
jgi:hypothetical protein